MASLSTKIFLLNLFLLGLHFQRDGAIAAQEMTAIDSTLFHGAKVLEVNFEYPINENLRFNLGDYGIIGNNEESGTYIKNKTRLLGMRQVTDIIKTFSFQVISSSFDTAVVITEDVNRVNSYFPNEVFENFFLTEITSEQFERFGAWITIVGDSSAEWTLYAKKGRLGKKRIPPEMMLSNGVRFIDLFTVSSDPYFDYSRPRRSLRNMPSMGVEFFENGLSICTIQYSAGEANNFDVGPKQSFGCKAWLHQTIDPKTELIVSAAMSAILLLNNPYLTNLAIE